jgi:hypothetical protein
VIGDGVALCRDDHVVAAAADVDLVVRTGADAGLGIRRHVAAAVADVDAHRAPPIGREQSTGETG